MAQLRDVPVPPLEEQDVIIGGAGVYFGSILVSYSRMALASSSCALLIIVLDVFLVSELRTEQPLAPDEKLWSLCADAKRRFVAELKNFAHLRFFSAFKKVRGKSLLCTCRAHWFHAHSQPVSNPPFTYFATFVGENAVSGSFGKHLRVLSCDMLGGIFFFSFFFPAQYTCSLCVVFPMYKQKACT